MKVVILCGGKGTRLREESEFRPKPMMPIGGRPILWHIMKIYACYGHREFILCLGYKGEVIREYFRNYRWHHGDTTIDLGTHEISHHSGPGEEDWSVTLADTGEDSMTAYRVRLIQKYLGEDQRFMLTYGDGLGDINLNQLLRQSEKTGKTCTVTAVHPPGRFGELGLSERGDVRSFNEKPQAEGGYINGGFMVCDRRLFSYLPDDPTMMLEQAPMKQLAGAGQLGVYRHESFWQPMDTLQEHNLLNRLWNEGKAPWKTW